MAKLKVYCTTAIRKHDGMPAPEGKGHHRQVKMAVATTSQKMAAALMDMRLGDYRWSGSTLASGAFYEACLAQPGAVFWKELDDYSDSPPLVWRSAEEAEADRLSRVARDEAFKARQEEVRQEYETDRARRQESNQAAADWARRLQEEFGLACEPAKNGRVEITTDAERLYGNLVEIAGILRDLEIDLTL